MPTVLIDIDSLRKDHLPFHGYSINTAPNLSSLAEDSAVFESFYADDTPSMPSRATIISGRTSLSHQVTSHHATDQIMGTIKNTAEVGENLTKAAANLSEKAVNATE